MIRKKYEANGGGRESSGVTNSSSSRRLWLNPLAVNGSTTFYPLATNTPPLSQRTPFRWLFAKVKEMWAFGS